MDDLYRIIIELRRKKILELGDGRIFQKNVQVKVKSVEGDEVKFFEEVHDKLKFESDSDGKLLCKGQEIIVHKGDFLEIDPTGDIHVTK